MSFGFRKENKIWKLEEREVDQRAAETWTETLMCVEKHGLVFMRK